MRKSMTVLIIFTMLIFNGCQRMQNNQEMSLETEGITNIHNFRTLKEAFLDNQLNIAFESHGRTSTIKVSGSYDLNGDGEDDKINCSLTEYTESRISIGNKSLELLMEDFAEASDFGLIDINVNDPYKEIVITNYGADELYYSFIRYNGNQVINLGDINSVKYLDEQGRIYSLNNLYLEFAPEICSGYYIVADDKLEFKEIDIKTLENREYKVKQDIEVYFEYSDSVPERIKAIWDLDIIQLKKGEMLKINKMGVSSNNNELLWMNVNLESGTTGNVYIHLFS